MTKTKPVSEETHKVDLSANERDDAHRVRVEQMWREAKEHQEKEAQKAREQGVEATEPRETAIPYPTWEGARVVLDNIAQQAYHSVHHTETYNKPWVDGETQMTLDEIGTHVQFIKSCMAILGVAMLAILLITLIK